MANLKIKISSASDSRPKTTVTIPGVVLKVASKLIPKQAMDILQKQGIDIAELIKLTENRAARGTLLEVEDHKRDEKVVVAVE